MPLHKDVLWCVLHHIRHILRQPVLVARPAVMPSVGMVGDAPSKGGGGAGGIRWPRLDPVAILFPLSLNPFNPSKIYP